MYNRHAIKFKLGGENMLEKLEQSIGYTFKNKELLKKALKEIHTLGGDYVSVLTSQLNV